MVIVRAGYVARIGEMRNAHRILFGNPQEKGSQTKMGLLLRTKEVWDWIHLTQFDTSELL